MKTYRPLTAGACLGIALALSACGASTSNGTIPAADRPHGPTYEVSVGEVAGLGKVLVNGKGFTLYLFLPDNHSSHSVCNGICAVAWPPLLLPNGFTAPLPGRGVKPSELGTTTRNDGGVQITYNGWPLYLWASDTIQGQASGEGLNNLGGLWYVVSPNGMPIK